MQHDYLPGSAEAATATRRSQISRSRSKPSAGAPAHMAALQLPGGPLRLHISRQECGQAGLDAATPQAGEQPLACSVSLSVDNSTMDAAAGAAEQMDLSSKQVGSTSAATLYLLSLPSLAPSASHAHAWLTRDTRGVITSLIAVLKVDQPVGWPRRLQQHLALGRRTCSMAHAWPVRATPLLVHFQSLLQSTHSCYGMPSRHLQPAATTSAGPPPAAAPVTLIARQRPRKLASPAASSPTSSSAARSAFRPSAAGAAATGADAAGPLPRRRCVLVAKQLTNSDASSGRIILPRVAGKPGAGSARHGAWGALARLPILAASAGCTPCMRHAWGLGYPSAVWMAAPKAACMRPVVPPALRVRPGPGL